MNQHQTKGPLCLTTFMGCQLALLLMAAPFSLLGQQVPVPAGETIPEEIFVLSAFEVRSNRDSGYRVQNSVATTGVAQKLIDTPLPITVITREFLRDAGLEGFAGSLQYTSSLLLSPHASNGNYAPSFGRGNSSGNSNRFRGQPYNGTFRNGLRLQVGFDTENVDRIEVAKGPMAVFVGGATLGGEVNLVTRKPLFDRQEEVSVRVGSHEYFRLALDATGPLSKSLAYRVIFNYNNKNTWRDWSHSQSVFFNPQVTWRLSDKFETRFDGYYRNAWGNLVSQNVSSTMNYQQAYDTPAQVLLDLGKKRTGALAGIPFTVNEYRQRIGQAFGTWRQDSFDATGQWVSLGAGEDLVAGTGPSGRAYNWYGPHASFKEPITLLENESSLVVNDWLQFHSQILYTRSYVEQDYYSFSQRQYAAGNNPLNFGSGTRVRQRALNAKLEGLLKKEHGIFNGTLLVGGIYGHNTTRTEDAFFDYSALAPVAASPNVGFSPAVLTGQNIYTYFDPRVHEFPDTRLVTRWPSVARGPGQVAFGDSASHGASAYSAGSIGVWDNRFLLTGGVRRAAHQSSRNQTLDSSLQVIPNSTSYSKSPYIDSWMYGVTARIVSGLNAFASYNRGNSARSGSLVGRVSFGSSPIDIVTPAEQAENPQPNDIGTGKELGLKFDLFNHKLTGSIGWFQLVRGNILVQDTARAALDPRNAGTEVDNNPATADPGVRARVSWLRPIDGNISEGFETDLVWTPTPNYSVILGMSHLTENKITVDRPLSNDPLILRDYTILNGRPLVLSPDDMIRVFQRYTFTTGRLKGASVGVGVRYQSSFWPAADNSAWGLIFPSYTVGEVILGYKTKLWNRNVDFAFKIDNITNSTYIDGDRIYGPPREFSLSTSMAF